MGRGNSSSVNNSTGGGRLLRGQLGLGFGVPATITTDQGTQFTGGTWQCMCRALGVKHVQTTAYHLQSNRMV